MKVGDKVVCINDKIRRGAESFHSKYIKNWIKEGETYTLRKIDSGGNNGAGVLLKEVTNPIVYVPDLFGKIEPRFGIDRFRPLEEVLDSISISEVKELEIEEV